MTPDQVDAFFSELEIAPAGATTAEGFVDAFNTNLIADEVRRAVTGWPGVKVVYRGQRNCQWGIVSSLAREVSRGRHHELTEKRLCDAEERILREAQAKDVSTLPGPGTWLGRNLSDGEILAVLQHQEAPTRFIDVTEDPLVALYFAADKEDTTPGRVFIILLRDNGGASTRDPLVPDGLTLDLAGPTTRPDGWALPWPRTRTSRNSKGAWTNSVFHVDAGRLDPRISAQRGSFIVGGLARAYGGGIVPASAEEVPYITSLAIGFRGTTRVQRKINESARAYAWTVRVPAELKPGIRDVLRHKHQVHQDSLFPDYREFKRLAQYLARQTA